MCGFEAWCLLRAYLYGIETGNQMEKIKEAHELRAYLYGIETLLPAMFISQMSLLRAYLYGIETLSGALEIFELKGCEPTYMGLKRSR